MRATGMLRGRLDSGARRGVARAGDRGAGAPVASSGRRRWAALGALAVTSFVLLLQDTAVSVVLPAIGRDLGLSLSGLGWVINAYTVALAALTLAAGRLADAHGRRRVFLLGIALFSAASLLAGAATAGWLLIAARAVQGTGAALAGPAALAMIWSLFEARERGVALGVWAGASSLGLGLGPIAGALLSESLGWRAILLINIPLGALAWAAVRLTLAESRDVDAPRGLPAAGVLASAGAVVGLMLALTRGSSDGWTSSATLSLFAAAAISALAFALSERRSRHPLVDWSILRHRARGGANVVSLLSTAVMCNLFFFLALYFQTVRGMTSLGAAAGLLPLTGLIVVLSPPAGRLSDRLGRRSLVVAGLVTLAAALGLLSQITVDTPLAMILLALTVTGAGIGLSTAPTVAAALDGIPDHQTGQASAVLNTSRALGLALGIATMGALLSSATTDVLRASATTRQAFVDGLSNGLALNAVIALVAAAVALRTLGAPPGGHRRSVFALRKPPPGPSAGSAELGPAGAP